MPGNSRGPIDAEHEGFAQGDTGSGRGAREIQYVSKAAYAKQVGVTKQAVGKACKPGGPLFDATQYDGKRIDTLSDAALKYASDRTQKKAVDKRVRKQPKPPPKKDRLEFPDFDMADFENGKRDIAELKFMPMGQILQKFGTLSAFLTVLKAMTEMEKFRGHEIKNNEHKGILVSRRLVKLGLIDPSHAHCERLITDIAYTMGTRSHAMSVGGRSVDEVCEYQAKTLGLVVKRYKNDMRVATKKIMNSDDEY